MKKTILLFAISFSLTYLPSCGSSEKEKEKEKDKKELSTSDVPEPVRSAFSAKYSTATDIKWDAAHENDKQTYKAKFKIGDKKMKAEFDTNGTFVKESDDN
jgi:hypothetical protein